MGRDEEEDLSSYIDPTDYNNLATGTYQPPNTLEITESSSGCQQSLTVGGNVGTGCAQTFENPHIDNTATSANKANTPNSHNANSANSSKNSSPSWLKKSATAKLPTVTPVPRLIKENNSVNNQQETNENKTLAQVISRGINRISRSTLGDTRVGNNSHDKSSYQGGNYIPSPQEFSASTKVSDTPIAPRVGSLPSPMTEDQVAPRLSRVSYNFALAAVLPQVSYTSTIAYRGGHGMLFPLAVPAPITSLFGWRIHPITGDRRFHAGTDIGAPTGTPVIAAARGQVEGASWMGGYGLAVTINHTSAQQTLYGHLSEILVQPGQWVEPGTVIGRVGSTGNSTGSHLHFEVRHLTQNGWVAVDPAVRVPSSISREVKDPSSISQVVDSLPPVQN
ncbi:M23 family metallopeptidase [Anabaena sp. FACHB-1237]|nr:M23 family metallopeptidase [Anabaena sp. FACHB-1237]